MCSRQALNILSGRTRCVEACFNASPIQNGEEGNIIMELAEVRKEPDAIDEDLAKLFGGGCRYSGL